MRAVGVVCVIAIAGCLVDSTDAPLWWTAPLALP
jgi:hypothetical protein